MKPLAFIVCHSRLTLCSLICLLRSGHSHGAEKGCLFADDAIIGQHSNTRVHLNPVTL